MAKPEPNTKEYKLLIGDEDEVVNITNINDSFPEKRTSPIITKSIKKPGLLTILANTGALPILSYCGASILMTVTNKYVLSGYDFNMNFLLLTIQSIVCVALLHGFKAFKLINFREIESHISKKWLPIVVLLIAMIYTGSKSLQYLSIPVYTIFKNLTIILIAYGEMLWFGGSVTRLMITSFLLMILSSIIAAWADISYALETATSQVSTINIGYFWMGTNCLATASFTLTMRKRITLTGFKDFDTVYYNNLLSIPLLVVMSFLLEDWSAENLQHNFPPEIRNPLIIAMLFSGVSAFGISYSSAWCIRVTSSTTYSMVGALNKLPIAISGMIFFGDPITFGNVSAVCVGFIAGIVYTVAKSDQKKGGASRHQTGYLPMSASSHSMREANLAQKSGKEEAP
ncbi:4316_t:CDS:2 [Ambispora leptoticha]|uniref:GDP-mannose transporter n=1 Tax=Ambispora leptoticha TaxID=144679 RepID=A0A9N8YYL4_9GLOM|nr:4316_t:CDS:2 [Ambispora leptoticha]